MINDKKVLEKANFMEMMDQKLVDTCTRDVLKLIADYKEKGASWVVLGNEIIKSYKRLKVMDAIVRTLIVNEGYELVHRMDISGEELQIILPRERTPRAPTDIHP